MKLPPIKKHPLGQQDHHQWMTADSQDEPDSLRALETLPVPLRLPSPHLLLLQSEDLKAISNESQPPNLQNPLLIQNKNFRQTKKNPAHLNKGFGNFFKLMMSAIRNGRT